MSTLNVRNLVPALRGGDAIKLQSIWRAARKRVAELELDVSTAEPFRAGEGAEECGALHVAKIVDWINAVPAKSVTEAAEDAAEAETTKKVDPDEAKRLLLGRIYVTMAQRFN